MESDIVTKLFKLFSFYLHNLYVKNILITSVSNIGDTLIDYAVGKGGDKDSLEEYYNNFRNSQRIFGSIMNLSPGLSALKRLDFSFNSI